MKKIEKRKNYKWLKLKEKVEVIVPENVLNQIRYLCDKISHDEWSAILFYDVEGDITNLKNFKITLREIFPMDKGTTAHTSYELGTPEMIDFRMDNPEVNFMKMGHIHSHNNMAAYFSNEDNEEIEDNAELHNYYLSMVVNNRMDFVAKISFVGVAEEPTPYKCKSGEGNDWTLKILPSDEQTILSSECVFPKDDIKVSEEFTKQVENIIIQADKKEEEEKKNFYKGNGAHQNIKHPPAIRNKSSQIPLWNDDYEDLDLPYSSDAAQVNDELEEELIMSQWTSYFLGYGQLGSDSLTIEEVLSDIDKQNVDADSYIVGLVGDGQTLFNRFFEENTIEYLEAVEYAYEKLLDVFEEYKCGPILIEGLVAIIKENKELTNESTT